MYESNVVLKSANDILKDVKEEFVKQRQQQSEFRVVKPVNLKKQLRATSLINKEEEEEEAKRGVLKDALPLHGASAILERIKENQKRRKEEAEKMKKRLKAKAERETK